MGLVKKIWSWLTASPTRRPTKGHPDLSPIDVDKLAQELRLHEEARRLGEAGLPTPDATEISGPEASALQRVEKARQDYVDWAVTRLGVLSEDLGRHNITQEVNRARQADKEFERKASARLSEDVATLRWLAETARQRRSELDSFKAQNQLERHAHYPTAAGSFYRYRGGTGRTSGGGVFPLVGRHCGDQRTSSEVDHCCSLRLTEKAIRGRLACAGSTATEPPLLGRSVNPVRGVIMRKGNRSPASRVSGIDPQQPVAGRKC